MRYTASRASWSSILGLVVALATAGCSGGGSESPDARPPVDATATPDAAPADAGSPPPPRDGHPGAALVPAGGTARSAGYRFVGTLTPGTPAASSGHTVRTGVTGATQ